MSSSPNANRSGRIRNASADESSKPDAKKPEPKKTASTTKRGKMQAARNDSSNIKSFFAPSSGIKFKNRSRVIVTDTSDTEEGEEKSESEPGNETYVDKPKKFMLKKSRFDLRTGSAGTKEESERNMDKQINERKAFFEGAKGSTPKNNVPVNEPRTQNPEPEPKKATDQEDETEDMDEDDLEEEDEAEPKNKKRLFTAAAGKRLNRRAAPRRTLKQKRRKNTMSEIKSLKTILGQIKDTLKTKSGTRELDVESALQRRAEEPINKKRKVEQEGNDVTTGSEPGNTQQREAKGDTEPTNLDPGTGIDLDETAPTPAVVAPVTLEHNHQIAAALTKKEIFGMLTNNHTSLPYNVWMDVQAEIMDIKDLERFDILDLKHKKKGVEFHLGSLEGFDRLQTWLEGVSHPNGDKFSLELERRCLDFSRAVKEVEKENKIYAKNPPKEPMNMIGTGANKTPLGKRDNNNNDGNKTNALNPDNSDKNDGGSSDGFKLKPNSRNEDNRSENKKLWKVKIVLHEKSDTEIIPLVRSFFSLNGIDGAPSSDIDTFYRLGQEYVGFDVKESTMKKIHQVAREHARLTGKKERRVFRIAGNLLMVSCDYDIRGCEKMFGDGRTHVKLPEEYKEK